MHFVTVALLIGISQRLFAVPVQESSTASKCYDCDYDPSKGDSNRGFRGCALESEDDLARVNKWTCTSGTCFIRKDKNGLVFRGCADQWNLPWGVSSNYQCESQGHDESVWWFCNGDLCNRGSMRDLCESETKNKQYDVENSFDADPVDDDTYGMDSWLDSDYTGDISHIYGDDKDDFSDSSYYWEDTDGDFSYSYYTDDKYDDQNSPEDKYGDRSSQGNQDDLQGPAPNIIINRAVETDEDSIFNSFPYGFETVYGFEKIFNDEDSDGIAERALPEDDTYHSEAGNDMDNDDESYNIQAGDARELDFQSDAPVYTGVSHVYTDDDTAVVSIPAGSHPMSPVGIWIYGPEQYDSAYPSEEPGIVDQQLPEETPVKKYSHKKHDPQQHKKTDNIFDPIVNLGTDQTGTGASTNPDIIDVERGYEGPVLYERFNVKDGPPIVRYFNADDVDESTSLATSLSVNGQQTHHSTSKKSQTTGKKSHQPAPKKSHQPAPKKSHQPAPKKSHQPAPKKSHVPVKTHVPVPKKTYVPTPKKSHVPAPKKSHMPTPKKSHVPVPKKSHIPAPKKSHVPAPKKSHVPAPKKSHVPAPKKSHMPAPKKSHMPEPKKSHMPEPKKSHMPEPKKSDQAQPEYFDPSTRFQEYYRTMSGGSEPMEWTEQYTLNTDASDTAQHYGNDALVASSNSHYSSSPDSEDNNAGFNSYNPCDGKCRYNPSGLFNHPSRSDWFVQCGPGEDHDGPCTCCTPNFLKCPRGTAFDPNSKVCSQATYEYDYAFSEDFYEHARTYKDVN